MRERMNRQKKSVNPDILSDTTEPERYRAMQTAVDIKLAAHKIIEQHIAKDSPQSVRREVEKILRRSW